MYTIQAAGFVLAIATGALASQSCTPNALELTNLRRHYDMNTGSTFTGKQVTKNQLRVSGGTGCSPVWAGGNYDDSAMFEGGEYPEALKRSVILGNEAVMMRELVARHEPGDGMPMPKTPKKRHTPGDGMPMPKTPKTSRRSAHGPDENDGHFSMPQASHGEASEMIIKPRHGPAKSPTPPKQVQRRSPRPHGPSKSPTTPKSVQRRSPSPHGPDEDDGHFSYPVDRKVEADMEKRKAHGPDEDDGHFSYPVDRKIEADIEKREAHDPDEDDGHFSYPVDRKIEADMERRRAHGPDEDDGHFSYPGDQYW